MIRKCLGIGDVHSLLTSRRLVCTKITLTQDELQVDVTNYSPATSSTGPCRRLHMLDQSCQ